MPKVPPTRPALPLLKLPKNKVNTLLTRKAPPLAGFFVAPSELEWFCPEGVGGVAAPHGLRYAARRRISEGMKYILLFLTLLALPTAAQQVPQSQVQMQLSFAPLVKEAAPAVVLSLIHI